ncbi:MAG: hypothetical protein ACKVOE_08475 [Rickettsiales bacterium]
MADKPIDTEKYQGPTKVDSVLGVGAKYGLVGGAAGAAVGAVGASVTLKSNGKMISELSKEIAVAGHGVSGKAAAVMGVALLSGMLVSGITSGLGYLKGAKKAKIAQDQFDELKSQRDEARQTVSAMQTQMQGMQSEVDTHRKKFTDHIASRSEHGGHAGVAAHEQAQASHEGAAR